ncbi:Enoyl-CoA hydratase/isomerase, putative [Leishmania shawi]|uniref:Enoyl-CoA hydratase/isomerase n=1 Tax=Leishmania shawi TaxID=5680 RepID=A0ABR3EG63_9TRYP
MLWLGSNEETKAVVISSAIPTVYSAGLDLAEVHNPNPERISGFWQSFQEMWLIFNSFPKPIIAAVTGNAPAAGCIIAMGCDYRVMARGPKDNTNNNRLYRIGLNETKLGLVAPPWTMPAYAYLLGSRQAERMLQLGETPLADDAHKLGLIDEVAPDEERTIEAAYKQAERFLSVPQQSRWMARDMMRREYLQMLASDEERNYDTEFFTQFVMNPEVQHNLERYLERLKSRSRK